MKTVGDFKKAGLVFVGDDKLRSETNNHDSDEICMSRCWLGHGIYRGFLEVSDCYFANKEWVISSFAWRENTGVKPEFKGLIDVLVGDDKNSEQFNCINASDLVWDTNPLSRVIKWCPSLNQPQQWPDNSRMDIISQNGNDGLHYDNTAQQVEALAVKQPTEKMKFALDEVDEISAKVINDKPIFTQAMADNGELPPVGSLVDVIGRNGVELFYGEGEINCEVLAHVENTAVIKMGYGLGCFSSDALKASDTRTGREKSIDEIQDVVVSQGFLSRQKVSKEIAEKIYDAGYRKC